MRTSDIFATHNFGQVSPWVDLVNSEECDGFGNFSDRLDDPAWLESFLGRWHLHLGQAGKAPLPALKSLRRSLRGVAEALSASGVPDAREIAQINAVMDVPVRQRLVGREKERRIEIAPLRSDWDWILSRIAASAAEAAMRERIQSQSDRNGAISMRRSFSRPTSLCRTGTSMTALI